MRAACALSYSIIFKLKAGGGGRKPHTHTPALAQGLGIIFLVIGSACVTPLSSWGTFTTTVSSNFILKQLHEASLWA